MDEDPVPSEATQGPAQGYDVTEAWGELLDGLRDLDAGFLRGAKAVRGEQAVVEGYRFLATVLCVAFDAYLFADAERPRFIDINTPFRHDRRWGGDNTDAYYSLMTLDPRRTYRVGGQRGDSVYFSLTVYNEPSPGEWSNRIVGILNDSDLEFDGDGRFELILGPTPPDGYDGQFIELSDDASVAVTRDYQVDPWTGRRVPWSVELIDPPPARPRTDAETAQAVRSALRWIQEMFAIVPLTIEPRSDHTTLGHVPPAGANSFGLPYQVGDANYGWSARDACYSFGNFSLEPDEALVITHRPPQCQFWNLTIWNQFMAGQGIDRGITSINSGGAVSNGDGTVTAVVAHELLDHPNAMSTIHHPEGVLAFRWFRVDAVPEPMTVELIKAADAPTHPT